MSEEITVFVGSVAHSTKKAKVTLLQNAAVAVRDGQIIAFEEEASIPALREALGKFRLVELKTGQFLCPGLIDVHLHAPQFPNIGLGCDKELLEWLSTYTFPLEKKYYDRDFANTIYRSVVKSTLAHGTTTACYYATIHKETAILLAEIVAGMGQRAIVGKVNMDGSAPDDYLEDTQVSLEDTREFIKAVKNLNNPLVEPAVTPRFAVSCSMELMAGLGKIAEEYGTHIQTHISESKGEIDFVLSKFKDQKNYTDVYNTAGLLTKKTILGHGVFLSGEEQRVIGEKGASVAHCPVSNIAIQSGICNVQELWASRVKVGLGTDMSGGFSPSILEIIREAISSSTFLAFRKEVERPLTFHEGFYLATLGGAEAIGKEAEIGNFARGKFFDALVVDMTIPDSDIKGVFPFHSLEDLFQKFIYCGDDRNIVKVFVQGKLVKDLKS